jgi:sporulation protein YlmC with PRC-barrel domain
MTSLRNAIGKPAILRDTAEQLGAVSSFVVDADARTVTDIAVSAGRTTRLVEWVQVESIGPDAVIVDGSREATGDDDRALSGAAHPLEKRALSDRGNELGTVTDVEIDDTGAVRTVLVGDQRVDGARLEGVGSYAVVVAADPSEA